MIFTGMIFLMIGMAMVNQMTLIGNKPKDKRPGWAMQLLGVGMIYHGWMSYQTPFLEKLWNMSSNIPW
ncbi:hypothetical protein AVV44_gp229 [Cronobacter phage S13]|jgi:hypothetical protein|uniref:Uncharacterized protein n=1 Tax=Cronobacter phage LPCS28 TaxID=2924885 RepID=A0AAE9GBH0_9CAUD|nr:hypothetical protein AVV44_gp229 [Cronobacter phage S13]YP_010665792.1 hypothetical protein PQB73_gp232 [Cronobacter phage LPCS28]AIA65009.1 hypothetical protein S13_212 [Cronobacter phage S13]UNY46981.1 hypothetical protein EHEKIMEA_00099 [Cronobacter phage LPCS28]